MRTINDRGTCDLDGCEVWGFDHGVMYYTGEWADVDGRPIEVVKIYCSPFCLDVARQRGEA